LLTLEEAVLVRDESIRQLTEQNAERARRCEDLEMRALAQQKDLSVVLEKLEHLRMKHPPDPESTERLTVTSL